MRGGMSFASMLLVILGLRGAGVCAEPPAQPLPPAPAAGVENAGDGARAAKDPAAQPAGPNPAARTAMPGELPPDIRVLLAEVTDRGMISQAEAPAYYSILAHAKRTPPVTQRAAAQARMEAMKAAFRQRHPNHKFSLFVELFNDPVRYRGEPVTLHGYIRSADSLEAGYNEQGVQRLYQAMFYTTDSEGNPYTVICGELPANLPQPSARSPVSSVSVTGYFFKCWVYPAGTERKVWRGPVILARQIEWSAAAPPRFPWEEAAAIAGALLAAAAGLTLFLMWQSRKAKRLRPGLPLPDKFELPPSVAAEITKAASAAE